MVSTRRRGPRRGRRRALPPRGQRAASGSARWRARRAGTASTATCRTPTSTSRCSSRSRRPQAVETASRDRRGRRRRRACSSDPRDLAGSMGLLGQPTHPDVHAAVLRIFEAVKRAGKPVGSQRVRPRRGADRYAGGGSGLHGRGRRRPAGPRLRGAGRPVHRRGRDGTRQLLSCSCARCASWRIHSISDETVGMTFAALQPSPTVPPSSSHSDRTPSPLPPMPSASAGGTRTWRPACAFTFTANDDPRSSSSPART